VVEVNLQEQMDFYNRLPPKFRLLCGIAPVQLDAEQFHQVLQQYGPDTGFKLIIVTLEREYPGWSFENAARTASSIRRNIRGKKATHPSRRRGMGW
jgi:hypothetical protein